MIRSIIGACCVTFALGSNLIWRQSVALSQAANRPPGIATNLPDDDPVRFLPDYVETVISFVVPERGVDADPEEARMRAVDELGEIIGGNAMAAFLPEDDIDSNQQRGLASLLRDGKRIVCVMWHPPSKANDARKSALAWEGVVLVALDNGMSARDVAEKMSLPVHKSESGQPAIYVQKSTGEGRSVYLGIINDKTIVGGTSVTAVESVLANRGKKAGPKWFNEAWHDLPAADFSARFWALSKPGAVVGGKQRTAGFAVQSGKEGDFVKLTFAFPQRRELVAQLGKEWKTGDMLDEECLTKLGVITYGATMTAKMPTDSSVTIEVHDTGRSLDAALATIATNLGIGVRE